MATVFGRVLLIACSSAKAEFLAERTRQQAVEAVKAEQPECQIAESSAGDLAPGQFAGLTAASLFSEVTAVVVTDLQDLADAAADEIVAYATEPSPDVAVVLVYGGGPKGSGIVNKLRKLSAVTEVKLQAPTTERDLVPWVRDEFRRLGFAIDPQAATALVQAIGTDLRALAGAAHQLVTDGGSRGEPITAEIVGRYFGGRAEVKGYEIADAALAGNLRLALERSRQAATAEVAPVLITSALAGGLRQLIRFVDAPRGLRDADLAAYVGAPPFKLRSLRDQSRAWDASGLRAALDAVAAADLDVKGAASDAQYAIERMLLRVTHQHDRAARGA